MKFILIRKQWIITFGFFLLLVFAGWYLVLPKAMQTSGEAIGPDHNYEIHMVTSEFSTKTEDGKEIEAYRWDPGTIIIPKDQEIAIRIYGVNGKEHPFYIEGTNYKGVVQKGKETVLKVKFEKEGTYRLICAAHADIKTNGPMIGYIVVDD